MKNELNPGSPTAASDRNSCLAELRRIVVGLRGYLEQEKALGLEGWARPRQPAFDRPAAAAPLSPPSPPEPLTLEEIRSGIGDCRRCKLNAKRTQIVYGVGNPRARLVFVGEAPGRDEDLQGEPFVGLAGQLLTRIIQAINLQREEVYIANIIKCRPPLNRNPEPDEIAACEPFLIQQLRVIRPRLIVALGAFAAQTLLKTGDRISSLRGRFHEYQGIPLMPTYHPAFLLRNPERKRDVWEDMKKVKSEYDKLGNGPSPPDAGLLEPS